jgi:hypothetical protein
MTLNFLIPFGIGLGIGIWIASYAWNKYYLGEIGYLRKRIMVEQLHVEQKKAEKEWTKDQMEIHRLWNGDPSG